MSLNPLGALVVAAGALLWWFAPRTADSAYYRWMGYPPEYATRIQRMVAVGGILFGCLIYFGFLD
ncbi:MAG: hypothetical protein Q8K89_01180 [Actinomycetota bacterium]|nr:hypothetical protein [Actinomycetota bacterium]